MKHVEGAGELGRKAFKVEFVMVPARWVKALEGANGATYELALVILSEAFKNEHLHRSGAATRRRYSEGITLSAEVTGMHHATRRKAAKELERRGLICLVRLGHHALVAVPY
jgi:hypothetical protein